MELQIREPNTGTATTLTVYRWVSDSVRKTLVELVAQSIAEMVFAKTHEPPSLALTAQALGGIFCFRARGGFAMLRLFADQLNNRSAAPPGRRLHVWAMDQAASLLSGGMTRRPIRM